MLKVKITRYVSEATCTVGIAPQCPTPLLHWQCLDVKSLFLEPVQTPSTFIIQYLISSMTSIK